MENRSEENHHRRQGDTTHGGQVQEMWKREVESLI